MKIAYAKCTSAPSHLDMQYGQQTGLLVRWNCNVEVNMFNISGGCCGSRQKKTRVGGWAWAWWLVTDVQRLSLEVNKRKCTLNNNKGKGWVSSLKYTQLDYKVSFCNMNVP